MAETSLLKIMVELQRLQAMFDNRLTIIMSSSGQFAIFTTDRQTEDLLLFFMTRFGPPGLKPEVKKPIEVY
jgi:hypothetical protein